MYKAFFNMSKTPFSKDISESSLYIGQHFKELQGRLKTAAAERLFLIVTGDSGCGKFADTMRGTLQHCFKILKSLKDVKQEVCVIMKPY